MQFQRLGLGSRIVRNLIAKEKVVRLQVLKVNPAIGLYRRLGLEVCDETDTHRLMKTRGEPVEITNT